MKENQKMLFVYVSFFFFNISFQRNFYSIHEIYKSIGINNQFYVINLIVSQVIVFSFTFFLDETRYNEQLIKMSQWNK